MAELDDAINKIAQSKFEDYLNQYQESRKPDVLAGVGESLGKLNVPAETAVRSDLPFKSLATGAGAFGEGFAKGFAGQRGAMADPNVLKLLGTQAQTAQKMEVAEEKKEEVKKKDEQKEKETSRDNAIKVGKLFNDYYGKSYQESANAFRDLKTAINSASGPGDLTVIFKFMKQLDPRSVVRQEEQEATAAVGGVAQGILAKVDNLVTGKRFTEETRKQMAELANQMADVNEKAYKEARKVFAKKSKESNLVENAAMLDTIMLSPTNLEPIKIQGGIDPFAELKTRAKGGDKKAIEYLKGKGVTY